MVISNATNLFINRNFVCLWVLLLVLFSHAFLDSGPFKYIIPINSNYIRYIDDILLIYLREFNKDH